MGTYESYRFVSDHAMISVLWPFPDVASPRWEVARPPGGYSAARFMDTFVDPRSPHYSSHGHNSGLRFPNSEIFHFEMLNVALSSQKSTYFYCFLEFFFEGFYL